MNSGRACGRLLALPALLAGLIFPSVCQATLVGPGDLAFIRFKSQTIAPTFDDLAVVLLSDADAGQLVSFRTGEYDEVVGKFGTGKHLVWEVTETLAAGTVVSFVDLDRSRSPTASHGIIQNPVNNMLSLPEAGATVMAYLGTDHLFPETFLAGISSQSATAFAGTGLVLGQTAIYLAPISGDAVAEAHYAGDRSGQLEFEDYRALIGNVNANWQRRNSTGTIPPFDSSNFTLQSGATVPESPAVVTLGVLMLLACLSLGARWRRQPTVALADLQS